MQEIINHFYILVIKKVAPFLVLAFALSCSSKGDREASRFRSIAPDSSGIDFANLLKDTPEQNIIEYLYYYNGGGIAVGDVNNDNLLDLYFTANQGVNRLYINQGGLKFKDLTREYGLPVVQNPAKWSTGVVLVDVDGDGFRDIYECTVGNYGSFRGSNRLYLNKDGKGFVESAEKYGLDFSGFSTQSAFFDYDQDGDLDMYLLNHSVHGTDTYGNTELRNRKDDKSGDRFFENQVNEGNGFVDVTASVGIFSSRLGYGLGLGVSDLNDDGYMDIYVGNDFHEDDYIYLNNGDKTFREVSGELLGHTSQFTMGLDIADINADGLMDVFSLDMLPGDPTILLKSGGDDANFIKDIKKKGGYRPQYSRNAMQLNHGNHFKDVALLKDVYATDWSWSVLIQDFDNDQDNDLFITNGIYKRPNDLDYINFLSSDIQRNSSTEELIAKMPSDRVANVYFENNGTTQFVNNAGNVGLSFAGFSNGAAYGDLDNDGDLDLVVNNLTEVASLFENRTEGDFLNIALEDEISLNKDGIGSTVIVYTDTAILKKEVHLTRGFQSAISNRLHFGLGAASSIDSLQVIWPDGTTQVLDNIEKNQFLHISKVEGESYRHPVKSQDQLVLQYVDFMHMEDDYADYQTEKLLPWSLSKEGPGVAVGDLNNDGVNDFYIGGAQFQPGKLFLSGPDLSYQSVDQGHIERDAGYEDVAAEFIDINGDGFLDLFVASGGSRFPLDHPLLEDRIYINNGENRFFRWMTQLPRINSSTVAYDEVNGNNVLFVGARSVPFSYGSVPESYLIQYSTERMEEIQFFKMGMVTDAVWGAFGDKNGLMVVGDWMPITFYEFNGSSLDKVSSPLLEMTNGFWNSVTTGDVNEDGKEDYFFGNAGLNSKWKPEPENPITMFLDDFDDNGQSEAIIFNPYFGEVIPFHSRTDLIKQVPAVNKKNNTNEKFSKAREIGDLIESSTVSTYPAYTAESKMLISDDSGYKWVKLPEAFQLGAIQDAVFLEKAVIYVGNDFTNYAVLGRSDANAGGIGLMEGSLAWKPLDIPSARDYRNITYLADSTFLVVPNADTPFIINLN